MGFAALCLSCGFTAAALVVAAGLGGCDKQVGGYVPVSAIARNGFVSDQRAAAEARGREIWLWGFVDHGNLYGDGGVKQVLQTWWSGEGPSADTWRFNLKAGADDAVGRSFPVLVRNDAGRDDLLRRLVADARAQRPTKLFVRGRLFTFEAPTQTSDLTGLYLEIESSQDIRFGPLAGESQAPPSLASPTHFPAGEWGLYSRIAGTERGGGPPCSPLPVGRCGWG